MTNHNLKTEQHTLGIQGLSQSQVGFMELVEKVKLQVESDSFTVRDKPQAEELCYIIAEMYKLPATVPVQIDGVKIPAGTVAEIYAALTGENLQRVINEFNRLEYIVRYKKSYLRTALYNSVFETASADANEANQNRI